MGDQDKRLRTVHVRELTAQAYDELDERLHSGWGKWSFDLERSVLRHQDAADYEIDVAGIDSCAEALDWILQISGKRWVTADDLGNFVRALVEILSNRLRSGGFDREPDWAGIVVSSR